MKGTYEKAVESVEFVEAKGAATPEVAVVLGSGLGAFADELEEAIRISYDEIPNFPTSSVEGHAGELVLGRLEGTSVAVMAGRFHYYEGYSMEDLVFPVRVLGLLGVRALLVTNAAGGIGEHLRAGDFMLIEDHLNLLGRNPLMGENDERFGPRFPDMSDAYDRGCRKIIEDAAAELGIALKKGVYAALTGPSYETPAEIHMLATLGAGAVGMSTVPEVIAANHMGIRVCGLSCISNLAAGITGESLSHEEVIETGRRVRGDFIRLLRAAVPRIGERVRGVEKPDLS